MAWREIWTSQQITVDAEGSRFQRVFKCDLADWLSGAFYYRVGQSLSYDAWFPTTQWTLALLITEIIARPTENQSVLHVDIYYSTNVANRGYERPDQVRSWECQGGVSLTEQPITYYQASDGTVKSVDEIWQATDIYINSDEDNKPPTPEFMVPKPNHELTFSLYGKPAYVDRIRNAAGCVNNVAFLGTLMATFAFGTEADIKYTSVEDTGKWLLADFRYTRLRIDCWRYDFVFREFPTCVAMNNADWIKYTWNTPYGDKVKIGANALDLKAYRGVNFLVLFDGMDKIDPEQLQGGGSQ